MKPIRFAALGCAAAYVESRSTNQYVRASHFFFPLFSLFLHHLSRLVCGRHQSANSEALETVQVVGEEK